MGVLESIKRVTYIDKAGVPYYIYEKSGLPKVLRRIKLTTEEAKKLFYNEKGIK